MVNIAFFVDYEQDQHNEQFEDFILKWEDDYNKKLYECQNRENKNMDPFIPKYRRRSMTEMNQIWGDHEGWPGNADYDLYKLIPTVYYYGYEGSSTAPPCGQRVYWRIQDLPMQISHDQYNRIKTMILDQKDENCKSSSKAYKGGVNRPIQEIKDKVWYCDSRIWDVKHPKIWCDKWPADYHGRHRIDKECSKL